MSKYLVGSSSSSGSESDDEGIYEKRQKIIRQKAPKVKVSKSPKQMPLVPRPETDNDDEAASRLPRRSSALSLESIENSPSKGSNAASTPPNTRARTKRKSTASQEKKILGHDIIHQLRQATGHPKNEESQGDDTNSSDGNVSSDSGEDVEEVLQGFADSESGSSDNLELVVEIEGKQYEIRISKRGSFEPLFLFATKKLENCPVSDLRVISAREHFFIKPSDTPLSKNVSNFHHFIVTRSESHSTPASQNASKIMIQLQERESKNLEEFLINMTETFGFFRKRYADSKSLKSDKVGFYFDGEFIKDDETPESLDLEGGEIIDIVLKP